MKRSNKKKKKKKLGEKEGESDCLKKQAYESWRI